MAKTSFPLAPSSASAGLVYQPAQRAERARNESSPRSFRLLFELGRGGMARVYLAESLASGIQKLVVLKILNQELARDAAMRAAFLREAELSGRMNHPNVVQVYEVLEHQATDVIVMEYVDGFPLSRILQEKKNGLSLRLHLSVVVQMLSGLHYFHELSDLDGNPLNGVHRDVSPHNVLVPHDGPAKVADFGIAKVNAPAQFATQTGLVKGKIQYMAPEQMLGDEVDRRADIFSAGVILWEAVAQRRMWSGRGARDIMNALTRGEVPRLGAAAPDAHQSLIEVAARATSVHPEDRYATALEMMEDTERAMNQSVGVAQNRELAEFMTRAFGELREIQRRGVNQALRNASAGPLGVLDCWTAGHAVQRPETAKSRTRPRVQAGAATFGGELTGASLADALTFSTGSELPVKLSGLSASGATVFEPAATPVPRRAARKGLLWLAAAALAVSGAAWLLPTAPPRATHAAPAQASVSSDSASTGAPVAAAPAPVQPASEAGASLDAGDSDGVASTRSEEEAPEERFGQPVGQPAESRRETLPSRGTRTTPRKPSPRAPSRPALDCSPPYRLLPTGVKDFKPECFPSKAPG